MLEMLINNVLFIALANLKQLIIKNSVLEDRGYI